MDKLTLDGTLESHIPFGELITRRIEDNNAVRLSITLEQFPQEPTEENILAIMNRNMVKARNDLNRMRILLKEAMLSRKISKELINLCIQYISLLSMQHISNLGLSDAQNSMLNDNIPTDRIKQIIEEISGLELEIFKELFIYGVLVKDSELVSWIYNIVSF